MAALLLSLMWSCLHSQVFPEDLVDISAVGHDGEQMCKHIVDTIDAAEEKAGASITACVTDAAADCRKGKRLAQVKRPAVVMLDCFAHQVWPCVVAMQPQTG